MESASTLLKNEVFDNNEMNILKLNTEDFGRESLLIGRESLGILKLNELDITLNDYGRESLGIIDVERLNISTNNAISLLNSPLNTAFLYPNSYTKLFPSTSTNSGDISFHSASLNGSEISKIYSVHSSNFALNETLNEAFRSGGSLLSKFAKDCQNINTINSIDVKDNDREQHSLPQIPESISCHDDVPKQELRRCISEGGSANKEKSNELKNLSVIEDQGHFEDSVFIEAGYLATKIQDISVINDADDLFNIDKTSPPKELDLEEIAEENIRPPLNIFKTIDMMIPPTLATDQNGSTSNTCDKKEYKSCENLLDSSIKMTPDNDKKLAVTSSQTLPRKRRSCGIQRSELENDINQNELKRDKIMTRSISDSHINTNLKEVKSILFNLSNIISNELEDDKQKEESKHLLSSLADILLSKSDDSKDSDHSDNVLLEKEGKDSIKSEDSQEPLDLSIKCKVPEKKNKLKSIITNPKIAIPKILGHAKQIDKSTNVKNEDDGISSKKLKPKKVESGMKKGPLKAVIPIGNMAKANGLQDKLTSPTLSINRNSSGQIINKKTSTPISEKNIKPIAQSTPESKPLESSFGKMKTYIPSSPLARTSGLVRPSVLAEMRSAFNKSKQNSGSAPNLLDSKIGKNSIERRHSASELKKPSGSSLKRSFSVTQEASSSILTKMKQNITKTRHSSLGSSNLKSNSLKNSENIAEGNQLKAKNRMSNIRPTNLISKINRKQGKENKC